jgi:hypothetical protein
LKITKTANNKNKIILSKSDWISIGEKANWLYVEAKFGDSVRKKYLEQGYSDDSIDYYLKDFSEIRKQKPKELFDDFPYNSDFNIPKEKRNNIDVYHNFKDLEFIVDYVKGQRVIGGNSDSSSDEGANIIYQDNGLTIMRADNSRQAIAAKGDYKYTWCVARSDGGNLFNSYRYSVDEPTFYFVRNDNKPKDDPYHFFVIQAFMDKNYAVTSGKNNGDISMLWDNILEIEPELEGKQELFKHMPITEETREKLQYYDNFSRGLEQAKNSLSDDDFDDDSPSIDDKPYERLSEDEFALWPYENKKEYLEYRGYYGITDRQFESLPKDLRNLYISVGGEINEDKYQLMKDDKQLMDRLVEICKRKIDAMPMSYYNLPHDVRELEEMVIAKNVAEYKRKPEDYPRDCPKHLLEHPEIKKGVVDGWISRLKRNREVYEVIPDEFKGSPEVHKAAVEVWSEFLRGNASSYDLLPIELQKDPEIIRTCVDYFVNFILTRDTDIPGKKGDYCGINFVPKELRTHPEIQEARLKKWIDLASVPIEHGGNIPEDLKGNTQIQESLLNGWIYELKDDEYSYEEMPEEFRNHPAIKEFVNTHFDEDIKQEFGLFGENKLIEAKSKDRSIWSSSFNDNYIGKVF